MPDNRTIAENRDIKLYLLERKVPQWKVALNLGMSEAKFIRLLRGTLSEDLASQIRSIADNLANGRK